MPKKTNPSAKTKATPKATPKRSFVMDAKNGSEHGRYMNNQPASAEIKAAKPLLSKKDKVNVTIRESTQGSKKKEYTYSVSKTKLSLSQKKSKELKKKIGFAPKFEFSAKKKSVRDNLRGGANYDPKKGPINPF